MEHYFLYCAKIGSISGFQEKEKYLKNNPHELHTNNDIIFICACENGQLETAKWLWNFSCKINSPININAQISYVSVTPFIMACICGKINVAKWLWELSNEIGNPIDLHLYNDKAFTVSCTRGKKEVCEWLCKLYSGYKIKSIEHKHGFYFIECSVSHKNTFLINKNIQIYNNTDIVEI